MKRLLFISLVLFNSCLFLFGNAVADEVHDVKAFDVEFPEIENKVRGLYENKVFCTSSDPDFNLSEICTAGFLRRLADANDKDSDGYAMWLLRSGKQDGDDSPSKVLSVLPGAGNTVIVHWTDMGHKGSTVLYMVKSDGKWKIDNATVPEEYNPL